jgi:hypothetical protein
MKRQMPDGSYREVGPRPAEVKGTANKSMATHLGGSRAGRRAPRRRAAA